jgi:hypothetical protein
VALDGLASIYGRGIERFYTGKGQTMSWMQDPYVMGEVHQFFLLKKKTDLVCVNIGV